MKHSKLFLILIFSLFVSQNVLWAALREEKKDKDGDGQVEQWLTYSAKNKVLQRRTDTNKDGKPDQFHTPVNGSREFVLKEYDRNFDGKVDKRVLTRWDGDKTIPVVVGTRLQRSPNPGYVTVWKEGDDNFDGIIDSYKEKKDKTQKAAPSVKIGLSIDLAPAQAREPEEVGGASGTLSEAGDESGSRIQGLNERHGL